MIAILLSLCAALGWGGADFAGGMASRKTGAYRAVFYGAIIGIFALLIVVVIVGEEFPARKVFAIAIIAGLFGTAGVYFLYYSMTLGFMGIAPPVSALLSAALPVIVSIFREGLPSFTTLLGFPFALFAIWMISQSEGGINDVLTHISNLKLPLLAGIGFGGYFILIHDASQASTYWPIIIARSSGLLLITLIMLIRHESWQIESSAWPFVIINGVLDVSGITFFVFASQTGRLDVAAVLGSLFPGVTVFMAWIFLREKISRNQWIGIFAALFAIVLMTI